MNCLVSMETTPRAPTWTVEDIGTQLHNKNDGEKKSSYMLQKQHFWARVREWWGDFFFLVWVTLGNTSEDHSCRQLIIWPCTGVFMPVLTDHLQETCPCGGLLKPKRDMVKHMDAFTWTILNINGCQDGACGRRQQPQANCDREREKDTHAQKKTVSKCREKEAQPLAYRSIYTDEFNFLNDSSFLSSRSLS